MKKILIGCAVVAALVVAALVAGVVWVYTSSSVDDVAVVVDGPVAVVAGEEFTLTAHIRNSGAKPQRLVDLDIADTYLDGIIISASEPAFLSSEHIALDSSVSHSFDQQIPANGELVVRLRALALRPGDFAGDFDFCINNSFACLPHHIRTVVRPEGEPTAAPAAEATPPATGGGQAP